MNCQKMKNLFSPYIEGELRKEEKEKLELHLKGCPVCRKELSLLKAVVQEVKNLDEVVPPADFLLKINEKLDKRSFAHKFASIWDNLSHPLDLPVLTKSLVLAASILIILYVVVGPGQVYFSKSPSKSLISHPAGVIFNPASYSANPGRIAKSREAIEGLLTFVPSYPLSPETSKVLDYSSSPDWNTPAAIGKARKAACL